MDTRAIFGINVLMSFVSSIVIAKLHVWPWLRNKDRNSALTVLVAPHMFLRFIGLSFIIPGVVSSQLPSTFAVPAAWGDFVAGLLAIVATIALARRANWAIACVWVFNLWGAADLLFAFVQGARVGLEPGTPWRRFLHRNRDRATIVGYSCASFCGPDQTKERSMNPSGGFKERNRSSVRTRRDG